MGVSSPFMMVAVFISNERQPSTEVDNGRGIFLMAKSITDFAFKGLSDDVPQLGLAEFLDSFWGWVEGVKACSRGDDGLDVNCFASHLLDDRQICGYTDKN
jgi:hypothetical protein